MIGQQVPLSGDAEWPKVADAVIEAFFVLFQRFDRRRCWCPPPGLVLKGWGQQTYNPFVHLLGEGWVEMP